MEYNLRIDKTTVVLTVMLFFCQFASAGDFRFSADPATGSTDSLTIRDETVAFEKKRFIHSLGADFRAGYIVSNNEFLRGANISGKPIRSSVSAHLRYALQFRPGSSVDRIYKGVYQGIGAAYYNLGNTTELGNPVAIYVFQGARIAQLGSRLSLNYEWNLGLSFGWKPYDPDNNPNNTMTGGKINAYINADIYLDWILSRRWNVQAGLAATHFSNGNTQLPNIGLNSLGLRIGLIYNFGRETSCLPPRAVCKSEFPRHMSYDLTLFGSWRSKVAEQGGRAYLSPLSYPVMGINFAAMYNFGFKFRAGLSLDGVCNTSTNVYIEERICEMNGDCPEPVFRRASFAEQSALGVSVRGELVMPYFSVGIGLGVNMLRKGETRSFYQMITLKADLTRNSYLHIGFCMQDYLMLGLGYRFNNKYPRVR